MVYRRYLLVSTPAASAGPIHSFTANDTVRAGVVGVRGQGGAHGADSRVSPALKDGFLKMRDGLIGDAYLARALCFQWRDTMGRTPPEPGLERQGVGNNRANFIEVVRARKASDLNATLEDGAISCTPVHLANISYRLGRTVYFDAERFQCVGDDEANRMFTRNYRKPSMAPKLA